MPTGLRYALLHFDFPNTTIVLRTPLGCDLSIQGRVLLSRNLFISFMLLATIDRVNLAKDGRCSPLSPS